MFITQILRRDGGLESLVASYLKGEDLSSRCRASQGGRTWVRPRDAGRVTGFNSRREGPQGAWTHSPQNLTLDHSQRFHRSKKEVKMPCLHCSLSYLCVLHESNIILGGVCFWMNVLAIYAIHLWWRHQVEGTRNEGQIDTCRL